MPGGSDSEFNALYQIACESGAMATAAGGTAYGSGYDTEDNLVFTIACNIRQTILGLGQTPCGAWDTVDQAWQAILQMTAQLTGFTGTPGNFGNMEQPLGGIQCNLNLVAINTGQGAPMESGSYLNVLNGIACQLTQIVANGFSAKPPPPQEVNADGGDSTVSINWDQVDVADSYNVYRSTVDGGPYTLIASDVVTIGYDDNTAVNGTTYYYVVTSVNSNGESAFSNQASATPISAAQAFANSILDFAPDGLWIADLGTSTTTNGQPVNTWLDQSGHGHTLTGLSGHQPTLATNSVNGKTSLAFDGTAKNQIGGPFPIVGTQGCSIVVYKKTSNGQAGRIIDHCLSDGSGEATASTPVYQYDGGPPLSSYAGFVGPSVGGGVGVFHLNASYMVGTIWSMIEDGVSATPVTGAFLANPLAYITLGGLPNAGQAGIWMTGNIAFEARWNTPPSAGDITSLLILIKDYYATP